MLPCDTRSVRTEGLLFAMHCPEPLLGSFRQVQTKVRGYRIELHLHVLESHFQFRGNSLTIRETWMVSLPSLCWSILDIETLTQAVIYKALNLKQCPSPKQRHAPHSVEQNISSLPMSRLEMQSVFRQIKLEIHRYQRMHRKDKRTESLAPRSSLLLTRCRNCEEPCATCPNGFSVVSVKRGKAELGILSSLSIVG